MLDIKKADSLPPVRRGGGRTSAEREQIKEALLSGDVVMIEDVEKKNEYPALQQRIRTAGKDIANMKVTVRFDKKEENLGDVYFQGVIEDAEVVSESDVATSPKAPRTRKS